MTHHATHPAPPAGPAEPAAVDTLTKLTVRELIAALVNLQDRLNHDAASGGYQHLPGQTHRRAALLQRERQIVAELRRRRTTPAAGTADLDDDRVASGSGCS